MLRFAKGTLRRLSANMKAQAPKRIAGLRRRAVRLSGALQSKDQANQFPCSVRNSDIVVFTFIPLFSEIRGKGTVPDADVLVALKRA